MPSCTWWKATAWPISAAAPATSSARPCRASTATASSRATAIPHFRVLKDIRKGDDIIIETSAGEYLYRVRSERVISTEDTEVLDPTPDAELSLITCYPFYYVGNAPERFLVEAQLVGAIRSSS